MTGILKCLFGATPQLAFALIILKFIKSPHFSSAENNLTQTKTHFERENIAVWFSTEIALEDENIPSPYTEDELVHLLNITHSRFRRIIVPVNARLNKLIGVASKSALLAPSAAANLNKNISCGTKTNGKVTDCLEVSLVDVAQEKFSFSNEQLEKMVDLAEDANSKFPGTVTTLSHMYEYINPDRTLMEFVRGKGMVPVQLPPFTEKVIENVNSTRELLRNSLSTYKIGIAIPINECFAPGFASDEINGTTGILRDIETHLDTIVFFKENKIDLSSFNEMTIKYELEQLERCTEIVTNETTDKPLQVTFLTVHYTTNGTSGNLKLLEWWKATNQWAKKFNVTVIPGKAFESTNNPSGVGWWRIIENGKYENVRDFKFEEKTDFKDDKGMAAATKLLLPEKKFGNVRKEKFCILFDHRVALNEQHYRMNSTEMQRNLYKTIASTFSCIHPPVLELGGVPIHSSFTDTPKQLALYNRDGEHGESLKMWMGFHVKNHGSGVTGFEFVKELSIEANGIFPDTVTSLIAYPRIYGLKSDDLQSVLNLARNHSHTATTRFNIGVAFSLTNCFDGDYRGEHLKTLIFPILPLVDFVVLQNTGLFVGNNKVDLGIEKVVQGELAVFERCKRRILRKMGKLNVTNVDIVFGASLSESDMDGKENVFAMANYWDLVTDWAEKVKNTVLLSKAFDQPLRKYNGRGGWWKIMENDSYVSVSDYKFVEKRTIALELSRKKSDLNKADTIDDSQRLGISSNFAIILGTGIGVTLLLILAVSSVVLLLSKQRLRKGSTSLPKYLVEGFFNGTSDKKFGWACQPYDKCKLELTPEEFEICKDETSLLGAGNFSVAYKATVSKNNEEENDILEAAAKMPKGTPGTRKQVRCILQEIKILSFVGHHANVVRLVGAHTADLANASMRKITVFLELCALGSLDKYLAMLAENLRDSSYKSQENASVVATYSVSRNLPLSDMYRWCQEIHSGMTFLASKRIVHCDLAARNVLLDGFKCAKISDFGFSRYLDDFRMYVQIKKKEALAWRWMAPEALRWRQFTEKTDVWAFGVTLWEIFTLGNLPYPHASFERPETFLTQLEGGRRLERPLHGDEKCYQIMRKCWNGDANNRPTFSHLKHDLTDLQSFVAEKEKNVVDNYSISN